MIRRFALRFYLSLITVFVGSSSLFAQNCSSWQNVSTWKVDYSVSFQASGEDAQGRFDWNIKGSASSTYVASFPVSGCNTGLAWFSLPTGADGSGSVQATAIQNCPNGITRSFALTLGPSGPAVGTFQLYVYPTNHTYKFLDTIALNDQGTATTCDGSTGPPAFWNVYIASDSSGIADFLTFSLPDDVSALSQTDVHINGWLCAGTEDPSLTCVAGTFVVSFTLTPEEYYSDTNNVDDDCSQSGGSTISCQNQSLGEDLPLVGTGFHLHYESDRQSGTSGADPVAVSDAKSTGGWTLDIHHVYDPSTGTVYLGDGEQRSAWQLGQLPTYEGNTLVTSRDGSEVYLFSPAGRHLKTLMPMTGALKYQFDYDGAGNLKSVTDASGNITEIQRSGNETIKGILSPYYQETELTVDSGGYINRAVDPAGDLSEFINTPNGLMESRTDPDGRTYQYMYDGSGRLTLDSDPAGGSTRLARQATASGYSVTTKTALGSTNTYGVTTGLTGEEFVNRWPDNLTASASSLLLGSELSQKSAYPNLSGTVSELGPDPRWGLQSPVTDSAVLTRGNLKMAISETRAANVAGDPFALISQSDIERLNGRAYVSKFTGGSETLVTTSPMARTTTTVLDSQERISETQSGSLYPVKFTYDSRGRTATVARGSRVTKFEYDASGFLSSVTDPLQRTTRFTFDADGRVKSKTFPDGRVVAYSYDNNGNLISVTPPGKAAHGFSFTKVNLVSSYSPPSVSGVESMGFEYDFDRNLTKVTHSDGKAVEYTYDSSDRLTSIKTPDQLTKFSFNSTTGNMASADISGGEGLTFGYNGPLMTSLTWSGPIQGSVARTYDNNFWVTSQEINGSKALSLSYDDDGLLTSAGELKIKRTPETGLINSSALGKISDVRQYDEYGALTGYTASFGTTVLYSVTLNNDADGDISAMTETLNGKVTTISYGDDDAGRLIWVKENGATTSRYSYDSNSNRISASTSSGNVEGTYDAEDRPATYGTMTFGNSPNGEIASVTSGTARTDYVYDELGELTSVKLPDRATISYIYDALNHRIGKQVNGLLTAGYLYDGSNIVAQLDKTGAVVSRFVYAMQSAVPDFMIADGVAYRIISDPRGSPRLVVNSTTGTILEEIDYDEFGNIVKDTNPGFQPFGFAGGLYDQDTKLVHFGARDYDPALGRWTAKDPILFVGGDTNLYGYAMTDPVNLSDRTGLSCTDLKKWIEDHIRSFLESRAAISIGPFTITGAPQSNGVNLAVNQGADFKGVSLGSVDENTEIGLTSGANGPMGDLFQVQITATLTIQGHQIDLLDFQTTFGDFSATPLGSLQTQLGRDLYNQTENAVQQQCPQCN